MPLFLIVDINKALLFSLAFGTVNSAFYTLAYSVLSLNETTVCGDIRAEQLVLCNGFRLIYVTKAHKNINKFMVEMKTKVIKRIYDPVGDKFDKVLEEEALDTCRKLNMY